VLNQDSKTRYRPSCLLIFPPVWEVSAPYLAGPALAAYLKSNGYPTTVIDANQRFWSHFKDKEKASEIHRQCREEAPHLPLNLDEAIAADWAATMDGDQFVKWIEQASLASPLYKLLVRRFGGFWRVSNANPESTLDYHDEYFSDISHSFKSLDSNDLRSYLLDNGNNDYRAFAHEQILPDIEDIEPSVLGISIIAVNQVVPALAIAIEARQAFPKLCIILGGPWITQLYDKLASLKWLSDLRFLLCPYQGEAILLHVLEVVETGVNDQDLFAALSSTLCKAYAEPSRHHIPLAELPTPDFHDLNLSAYAEPGHLPLMASRGCYWARCTFCSYPLLEPKYEVRPDRALASDISTLISKYGAEHIAFADPIISTHLALNISCIITRDKLDTTWGGFARLDESFTTLALKTLSLSGCTVLHWGFETGSKPLQDLIQKHIDLDTSVRILKDAHSFGIHNRVLLMHGFPDETPYDIEETIAFLKANSSFISSTCCSPLTIEKGTPLFNSLFSTCHSLPELHDLSLGFRLKPPNTNDQPSAYSIAISQLLRLTSCINIKH